MIEIVTTGRPCEAMPPNTVRAARVPRACCRTQSTHCTPTGAGRWHSGHTGRSHRWQRTYETRSGWRGQTGVPRAASAPGGCCGGVVTPARP